LIEHWDGHRWRESGTSRLGGIGGIGGIGAFNDIAFNSPRDGWAVGVSQRTSLTVHWDGNRWATVPSRLRVDRDGLVSVAAMSADDVWAVGAYPDSVIAHWDGAKWTARAVLPVKSVRLYSLMTLPNGDAWGVGEDVGGTRGVGNGIATRLHQGLWQVYTHIAPNAVTDVAASSPSDFWAISGKANGETLVLHRRGSRWRTVPYPFPTSHLSAIAARTANDVWAVGYRNVGMDFHTLATHWDGRRWSEVVLPSKAVWLNAAAVDSATTGAWVAGVGGLIAHITCVPRR
jgi:hypothetical protein